MGSLARIAPSSCSCRKIPRAKPGATITEGVALTFFLLLSAISPAGAVCLAEDPRAPGGLTSVNPRHFPVDKEFQNSIFVLTAKVISARDDFEPVHPKSNRYYPATFYRVARLKNFKGTPPAVLTIYTERSSGGFYMDLGKTYLLFVTREGSDYAIDNCGYSDLAFKSKNVFDWLARRASK